MAKAKPPTAAQRAAEIAKLDLHSASETKKRESDLLLAMLNTPPDPKTAKGKPKTRPK